MTEPSGDGVGTTQTSGPVVITGLEGLEAHVGQKLGVSDWQTVEQDDINTFAKLTGDEQWIHVDPERAKAGLYGTTIQHGFLTLGMATGLLWEVCTIDGFGVVLNYGLNKVRFPAPLPVGSRIRMHVEPRRGQATRATARRRGRLPADLRGRGQSQAVLRGRSRLPLLQLTARPPSQRRSDHDDRRTRREADDARMTTHQNPDDRQERRGQRHPHQLSARPAPATQTVVLVHGSGPGRDGLRELAAGAARRSARTSTCVAPDMVGFGYSDRPEGVEYGLRHLGRPDRRRDGRPGHREGAPGRQQLRRRASRCGIATQHPDRVDKLVLMGSMGVPFEITEGLDTVWGYEGTLEDMSKVMDYFAYSTGPGQRANWPRSGYEGAATSPASRSRSRRCSRRPRQRWVDAMTHRRRRRSARCRTAR